MKRVSVCMACFNGEKYIKEQIDSILVQLTDHDELIISDDGSTDRTVRIIESYTDKRVSLYKSNFRSHLKNFDFVLSKANGSYIFLTDQDDVWYPNKIEVTLECFKNYNLIVCNCEYTNENLELIGLNWFSNLNAGSGLIKNFTKNTYLGCCMAFDRKVLNAALPFPNGINSHDTWIGLIAEIVGRPYFNDQKLQLFRRHGLNFSNDLNLQGKDAMITNKSNSSLSKIVFNRLILLKNLLWRILNLVLKR